MGGVPSVFAEGAEILKSGFDTAVRPRKSFELSCCGSLEHTAPCETATFCLLHGSPEHPAYHYRGAVGPV
jgi:hypothetical protein